jgi:hypothetical protein
MLGQGFGIKRGFLLESQQSSSTLMVWSKQASVLGEMSMFPVNNTRVAVNMKTTFLCLRTSL